MLLQQFSSLGQIKVAYIPCCFVRLLSRSPSHLLDLRECGHLFILIPPVSRRESSMMQKVTKTFFYDRVQEMDPVSLFWLLLGVEIT